MSDTIREGGEYAVHRTDPDISRQMIQMAAVWQWATLSGGIHAKAHVCQWALRQPRHIVASFAAGLAQKLGADVAYDFATYLGGMEK